MLKLIILIMVGDIPNAYSKLNLASFAVIFFQSQQKLLIESHCSNFSYKDTEGCLGGSVG